MNKPGPRDGEQFAAPTITIERRRLTDPRLVSPQQAEQLFQERVLELECSSTVLTGDPL